MILTYSQMTHNINKSSLCLSCLQHLEVYFFLLVQWYNLVHMITIHSCYVNFKSPAYLHLGCVCPYLQFICDQREGILDYSVLHASWRPQDSSKEGWSYKKKHGPCRFGDTTFYRLFLNTLYKAKEATKPNQT